MKNILLLIIAFLTLSEIAQSQSGWQSVTTPMSNTCKIDFLNLTTGYVLGKGVFKTTDGGISWVQKTTAFDVNSFYSLQFTSPEIGYMHHNNNSLFKTTNGGNNWILINLEYGAYHIQFLNNNTGWFIHNYSISKTTDGGNTFTRYPISDTSLFMIDIDFINENTGWAAGVRSIYKTTNGGENWEYLSTYGSSNNPMYKVDFINQATGFVVGTSGRVSKTTNGGLTWQYQNLGFSTLVEVNFINSQTGWVSGGAGKLYKTTNTGENWVKYNIDSTLFFIDTEFINENTGWMTTNTNKLFKTTNGGTVFVNQTSSNVPENFRLEQNYPNPFNPSTKINYSIKKAGYISLSIFNAEGKEAATLVNENQTAGEYSVYFDASKLPSGTYYYRLSSDNFSETKKMVLIK